MSEGWTMQDESTVIVKSPNHGEFQMSGDSFTNRLQVIVNSVNCDAKGLVALKALVSEATSVNYFDCDLATLVAATIECSFDTFTINYVMADSDDDLWIADVKKSVGCYV